MFVVKNIVSYTPDNILHFYLNDFSEIDYFDTTKNQSIHLYNQKILEFDVDIDQHGNIGMVLLDTKGYLYYYYYNGKVWDNYLLYHVDLDVEEFKYLSIKFSPSSPYITFCWRNLSSPSFWSVVCYYKENTQWEKHVFSKTYMQEVIKPYILIRDFHYNLHIIYLTNNNFIYNINIESLSIHSNQWTNSSTLCNCIYIKFFHLDALIDLEGILHIIWNDKHKKTYCVKYITLDQTKNKLIHPSFILESTLPIMQPYLFYENKQIACYGLTEKNIFYAVQIYNRRKDLSSWSKQQATSLQSDSIYFFKIVQSTNNPFIQYFANSIVSSNLSDFSPIKMHESVVSTNNTISSTFKENEAVNEPSSKKLKLELYKKSQELNVKNDLLKSIENEMHYLKQEVLRLNTENKKYIALIHESHEKYKNHEKDIIDLKQNNEKMVLALETSNKKQTDLLNQITSYQLKLQEMEKYLADLNQENSQLKKEIEKSAGKNFFKKFFK